MVKKIGKRPSGLVAIVLYKTFTASLLTVTSIAIFLAAKNYDNLLDFSESLTLSGKRGIIAFVLEKLLNFEPRTLKFSAIAAGAYALITAIEAIGLWYEQAWARWLVLGVVGISIPPEIFELWQGFSVIKVIILLLNIAVFWYLLREFPTKPE